MKIKQHLGFISMLAIAFTACQQKPAETDNFLENEIKNIEAQHTLQTDLIEKSGKILNPRTIDEKEISYMYLSMTGPVVSSWNNVAGL